jgi:hypothetical protein
MSAGTAAVSGGPTEFRKLEFCGHREVIVSETLWAAGTCHRFFEGGDLSPQGGERSASLARESGDKSRAVQGAPAHFCLYSTVEGCNRVERTERSEIACAQHSP